MTDMNYFGNVRRIEEIISQLDGGRLPSEDSRKLFELGKKLIEECESILDRYSGTVEEISFKPIGN
jgi:exodeoxyribonuclease VII small subunit